MRRGLLTVVLLVSLLWSAPTHAGPFDVIVADGTDVTLCLGCGITLAGLDYGLLVNTGTADITIPELRQAQFSVVSSRPTISLYPFINIPNEQIVGVIHPGEAMGSIYPGGNELLLDLLQPGETLRDLAGMQFMAYQIERPGADPYEGPVDFDVLMTLSGYTARFVIHAQVSLGPHAISFTHATRVSATPGGGPTPLDCSMAAASPPLLWPPNHRLVPITIAGVVDASGNPVAINVTAVRQDEAPGAVQDTTADPALDGGAEDVMPASMARPGGSTARTCPDAEIRDGQAFLRAERSPHGNGRVYVISFTARDSSNAQCTGSVSVCVPRNRSGGGECVDDGPIYNALEFCGPRPGRGRMPENIRLVAPQVARGVVVFSYSLAEQADLELELFDVAGRRVASLERGTRAAGEHTVSWSPGGVARGVYFVRGRAGDQVVTRQVVLSSY